MAEQLNELHLMLQEKMNTGTAWTRNEKFDKDGYLVVKDLWDPEELYHPLPDVKGQLTYWDKNPEHFNHIENEGQVEGSLARYWHPQYRTIHTGVRLKLEKELGRKLYNTYYYDRYYFPGQGLTKHADRDACEISVSIHISTNLPDDYEGGNVQLLDEAGNSYFAPRKRGTIMLFDSRTQHRVLKVTKGTRKSIVGWTVGPRWK